MLRKEIDKVEMSLYNGLECDSDEETKEDEADDEYFSDTEVTRKVIDYDLDKMFEIITKRDFNKWGMGTIHNRYTKISQGDAGRKQISR